MARIDIRRPHSLSLAQARKVAIELAQHLETEFGLKSTWSSNKLEFKRSGVAGVMTVSGVDVHVVAELGFLVSLLKSKIESGLHEHFDEVLGALNGPLQRSVSTGKVSPRTKATKRAKR
ncbi:MAG: polyhydroxyalkanoic acid system family protein [Rubrivivax sp.]|mgnify:CR=1 FL=1|jgi:putative polyhydroxyalkanoate system protein|nr:polyhydroxyalkanoic acid system family protein [Rubrivivax sp.]